jgi:adenylate kinase
MVKVIVVTGTPGTGKTRLAKALVKKLGYGFVDVNKAIKKNKIYEHYDRKRKTYVVDEKKLSSYMGRLINKSSKGLVIDSHMSHFLDVSLVDLCIVCKCPLPALKRRLQKRKYSRQKIRDNLDAEIFDVCLNEAIERGHKVLVVDTSHNGIKDIIKLIRI